MWHSELSHFIFHPVTVSYSEHLNGLWICRNLKWISWMTPDKNASASSIRHDAFRHLEISQLCSLHYVIQTSSKGLELSVRQTDFALGIVMLSLSTHHLWFLKCKTIPILHCCRRKFLRQLDTCLCVPSGCHNFRCLSRQTPCCGQPSTRPPWSANTILYDSWRLLALPHCSL